MAALRTGHLLLAGFDLGVGMLVLTSTRDDRERRLLLITTGPVRDANEVWLIGVLSRSCLCIPRARDRRRASRSHP
ncbi:MAG: cytochrome d ubiquinol oxidase subunit II [Salinibacterium sp.]|nr:cytochrome d ubiquinol oxidase subunit II [Salinibacterium sp.]